MVFCDFGCSPSKLLVGCLFLAQEAGVQDALAWSAALWLRFTMVLASAGRVFRSLSSALMNPPEQDGDDLEGAP